MTYVRKPRRGARDWRAYLTAEEEIEIAAIDAKAAILRQRSHRLSAARIVIQNRATQRAKR